MPYFGCSGPAAAVGALQPSLFGASRDDAAVDGALRKFDSEKLGAMVKSGVAGYPGSHSSRSLSSTKAHAFAIQHQAEKSACSVGSSPSSSKDLEVSSSLALDSDQVMDLLRQVGVLVSQPSKDSIRTPVTNSTSSGSGSSQGDWSSNGASAVSDEKKVLGQRIEDTLSVWEGMFSQAMSGW
eukprot:CAMPEP_0204201186 /NCGR_PEP_ID=MMETSP0361-20130328/67278_1 /ASSEMBLY_ACC=CAM_ASM_000343 /TAXON_ID=268821 /ORGANISM="Scrippsiella Hangoei, Strain SHTV-5" /LENGTH=181 /DNA_ID=CAMNT_0051163763 /DNA_START=50 /DNA_END=592 /DNA_ORIENTATION=+